MHSVWCPVISVLGKGPFCPLTDADLQRLLDPWTDAVFCYIIHLLMLFPWSQIKTLEKKTSKRVHLIFFIFSARFCGVPVWTYSIPAGLPQLLFPSLRYSHMYPLFSMTTSLSCCITMMTPFLTLSCRIKRTFTISNRAITLICISFLNSFRMNTLYNKWQIPVTCTKCYFFHLRYAVYNCAGHVWHMVNCTIAAVTWSELWTSHHRFTFRILHSAILHFRNYWNWQ